MVDTNIWLWTAYPRISDPVIGDTPYQVRQYPDQMGRLVKAGASLYWCGLSFPEIANQVEETEFKLWSKLSDRPASSLPTRKEYRHNLPEERKAVLKATDTVWDAITACSTCLSSPVVIDGDTTTAARDELQRSPLDGTDLFILQAARSSGVLSIISDDGDFCTVPDIVLFTCNATVISSALAQGKLRTSY